jgi:hypothetical protein
MDPRVEEMKAFLMEAKELGILAEVVEVLTKGRCHKSLNRILREIKAQQKNQPKLTQ